MNSRPMSNIDKEWLQQKIAMMQAARDEIPFGLDEDDSNTLASLRITLASLEAEPVAYADPLAFHNFNIYRAGETDNKRMGREWMWANPDAGLIPVYTAPPTPVFVPDESAVELLATDLMKRIDKITGERHSVATLSSLRVSIVESCRAAMLQGAEHVSNRDELPDGWVACSERMPEEGQEIIVMDVARGKVQSGMIYEDGFFVDFNEQYYKVENPSHWMPLPAAPQQEVKNG